MALALQLAVPLRTDLPEITAVSPRHIAAAPAPVVGSYPRILQEPIFTPDRAGGNGTAGIPGANASIDAYAAVGVVTSPRLARAIVRGPDGRSRSITLGQELAGWRLSGLGPARLLFTRGGQQHALIVGTPAAAQPAPETPTADSGAGDKQ